tara:strand:+ start:2362 stop:2628 length:267 start_codon:yes stop_codon:yes gene_type:complete
MSKKIDLNRMTREFLSGESLEEGSKADVWVYIQSVMESLQALSPRTKVGERKVTLALEHMKSIRRHTRRMEERVRVLEESIHILEEGE